MWIFCSTLFFLLREQWMMKWPWVNFTPPSSFKTTLEGLKSEKQKWIRPLEEENLVRAVVLIRRFKILWRFRYETIELKIWEGLGYCKTWRCQFSLQAGLRTLHDAGPELKRAVSGDLEELVHNDPEPMHRVRDYHKFKMTEKRSFRDESLKSEERFCAFLFCRGIIPCLAQCGLP